MLEPATAILILIKFQTNARCQSSDAHTSPQGRHRQAVGVAGDVLWPSLPRLSGKWEPASDTQLRSDTGGRTVSPSGPYQRPGPMLGIDADVAYPIVSIGFGSSKPPATARRSKVRSGRRIDRSCRARACHPARQSV